jgi:hypothetical protein
MVDEVWLCPTLTFTLKDGSQQTVEGRIFANSNGRGEIRADFHGIYGAHDFAEEQKVAGETNNSFSVFVVGVKLEQINPSFTTETTQATFIFRECQLKNLSNQPIIIERQEIYLKSLQVIGKCSFSHKNTNYNLAALSNFNDQRKNLVQAVLHVSDKSNFSDVLLLLSLAQRCIIRSPIRKFYSSERLVYIELIPNESFNWVSNPLIPIAGSRLSDFMVQVLPRLPAVLKDLELSRLIHYYCLSITSEYAELKFILASLFMEALKFYWALNVGKKTPICNKNGFIRGFERSKNKNNDSVPCGFKELLDETYQSYGLNPNFTFIENRNAMFHSGAPGTYQQGVSSTWQTIKPELIPLYRQIDDVLLAILGYTGVIHRWDTPDIIDLYP